MLCITKYILRQLHHEKAELVTPTARRSKSSAMPGQVIEEEAGSYLVQVRVIPALGLSDDVL